MRPLLLLLLCVGCSAPVRDYSGEFTPAIAIACGVATVGDAAPPPAPSVTCSRCDDKGWFYTRDTGIKQDCPECDKNPPLSPPPTAEPQDAAEGHDAPAVEWLGWDEAKASGEPVFVVQHYADGRPCGPCVVLNGYLKRPEVAAFFNEHGVLMLDTVERWQSGSKAVSAPAIALAAPGFKPGLPTPIIKGRDPELEPDGFRLSSPEAFLQDVKAWFDAIPK